MVFGFPATLFLHFSGFTVHESITGLRPLLRGPDPCNCLRFLVRGEGRVGVRAEDFGACVKGSSRVRVKKG